MKKSLIFFFLLVFSSHFSEGINVLGSDSIQVEDKAITSDSLHRKEPKTGPHKSNKNSGSSYYEHRGFHFELNVGPAFGQVSKRKPSVTGYDIYKFTGLGAALDIKAGVALEKNFFLTFDILSKGLLSPDIEINEIPFSKSTKNSINEVTYGAGFTYFFLTNLFFSTTIGSGAFVIEDSSGTLKTDRGFSLQVRAGRHWWISPKWGISVGGTYGFTNVNHLSEALKPDEHDIKSDRFTIMAGIILH